MNNEERKQYIRFSLEKLGAANGHHEFERLAFQLARLRIASNLQEATGPVSAGGDQGRDFESYRTYLAGSLGDGVFVGKASAEVIVGACTLNKDTLSKINSDLKTIFSSDLTRPNRVIYFCEPNVPVGKRYQAQTACRKKYSADLDIYDGNWIAGELIAEDTFYLAQRFLSVSAEFSPAQPFDDRYDAQRRKWILDAASAESFGDFLEIRDGLRTSVKVDAARQDLEKWLAIMQGFADLGEPLWLVQRARYELCLAEIRGHHALAPADDLWRAYIAEVSASSPAEELADATVMLIYGEESKRLGQTNLSATELGSEMRRIDTILKGALESRAGSQQVASLLESRAMIVPFLFDGGEHKDVFHAMLDAWEKVVEAAKQTPFYPTSRLGDIFMQLNEHLGGESRFRELSAQVDELVTEREGESDLAARARTRAMQDLKHGRRIAALSEMHHARIGWFNDETIDGAILAMLLLSEIYDDLNLHYAARYYAAGALFVATDHPSDKVNRLISQAVFRLAKTFYAAGEGLSYLYVLGHALEYHNRTATEPYNWGIHEHVQTAFAQAAILRGISKVLAPEVLPILDTAIATWALDVEEVNKFKEMSEGHPWGTMRRTEIESKLLESIGTNPLSDLGPQKRIQWSALGITWNIEFHNAESRERAIDLAVTLQIVQAELAPIDLALIPSNVVLRLSTGPLDSPVVKEIPGNDAGLWSVTMPAEPPEDFTVSAIHAMAVCVVVLKDSSALPSGQFDAVIDSFMNKGLMGRVVSVRPIHELRGFFDPPTVDRTFLDSLEKPEIVPAARPLEDPELGWNRSPGPTYSPERANIALGKRYQYFAPSISRTLPRILADDRCRALLQAMRDRGMLDWQILQAVVAIVIGWQIERKYGRPASQSDLPRWRKIFEERGQTVEGDDEPEFDLAEITEERLEVQSSMGVVSTLRGWGLEIRRQTPDMAAIRELLDVRYRNDVDDLPHADVLAALAPRNKATT
jgi:hypothetical protein